MCLTMRSCPVGAGSRLASSSWSVAGGLLSLVCFPLWPNVTADAPLLCKCLSSFLQFYPITPQPSSLASLQITRYDLLLSALLCSLLGSSCIELNLVRCKRESESLTEFSPLISPFWVFSSWCALFCMLSEVGHRIFFIPRYH